MYPSRFRYEAPRSLDEAIAVLARRRGLREGAGRLVMSLVPLMKLRLASPELLVDINNLPRPRLPPGRARRLKLHIGALCRHVDLERPGAAPLKRHAADHGRGCAADRRSHRARTGARWSAPCVTPIHRATGRQSCRPRGFGRGASAGRPAASIPPGRIRHRASSRTSWSRTRSPSRPSYRRRRGSARPGDLKLERRVGDFATVGVAVALETVGDNVTRAGIGPDRGRRVHHRGHRGGGALVGRPSTADSIGRAR